MLNQIEFTEQNAYKFYYNVVTVSSKHDLFRLLENGVASPFRDKVVCVQHFAYVDRFAYVIAQARNV